MSNQPTTPTNRFRGLPLAMSLSVVLLVVSYLRIAGDSQTMLFRSTTLDSMLAQSLWGTTLLRNLILFGLAMLAVHMLYGLVCWLVARSSMRVFGETRARAHEHVFLWFVLFTAALLAFNAAHFTRSSLGEPYAEAMTMRFGPLMLGTWIGTLAVALGLCSIGMAAMKLWREGNRGSRRWLGGAAGAIALGSTAAFVPMPQTALPANSQPNVILIGVDSLRADIVDGDISPKVTPTISAFLDKSVQFTDAVTPLARTFPSMTSLLTGRHPHDTGAFMNLLPRDMIREGDTLGRIFKRAGYRSIYATDEVRFANIDESYGFDQVITPPIGASEFLIGMVADTPVSNILINTFIGKKLFPHVYANRGASKTYDPDSFVNRIESETELQAPLFFTTHLTLAHWPYLWADAPHAPRDPDARWPQYYLNALGRVDAQLASLLAWLGKRGVLENAIVVLYSDHGEAFGRAGESLCADDDPVISALSAHPDWGHGVSVLSPHQYHIVLGFRGYGAMATRIPAGRTVDSPVSIIDVAPTLVALADAQTQAKFGGQSLERLLTNQAQSSDLVHRVRFTETEFAPINIASQDGKLSASAIQTATQVYKIDQRTDRLEVKRDRTTHLLAIRQYAALGDNLLLAAVPSKLDFPTHYYMVLDMHGGAARVLSRIPDPAAEPELGRLWEAMQEQFAGVVPREPVALDNKVTPVASSGH